MRNKRILYQLGAFLCCMIWGSIFPIMKVCYQEMHIPSNAVAEELLLAGLRFSLAGIILLLLFKVITRGKLFPDRRDMLKVFGYGLEQTTLQYTLFYIAIGFLPGSRGSIINATNAFLSVILAHFLTKSDRMNRYKVLGCVVGLGGLVVLGTDSGSGSGGTSLLFWDLLMFLAGASFSVSNLIAKSLSRRVDPVLLSGWGMLFGGVVLCIIAAIMGAGMLHGSLLGWGMFVALALSSVISVGLWNWLLKRCPVSSVSVYTCLMPVISSLLSAVLLREQVFTLTNLLSLFMVSSGVFFVNFHFEQKAPRCMPAHSQAINK